ncbi:hypothetical protein F2P81_002408 [Scophthalmus maximus]|uniref:F-box domain-containing protein n=1 Tax=Scophthalmus maximus TaxID=52904 RepID=A0A6A4TM10_SCOMX|nr:hypothetical protein F2P81_002408 [Scophthalmus maximus]
MEERKLKRKSPRTSTNTAAPTGGSGRKNSASGGGRHAGSSNYMKTNANQKSKSRRGVRDKPRCQAGLGGKTNPSQGQAAPTIQHSFLTDVSDVQEMEKGLLSLLNDFHSGKLQAFGNECSIDQMEQVREMQEKLARLQFDLYGEVDEMPEDQRKTACDTNMDNEVFSPCEDMETDVKATPQAVKRWQLSGTEAPRSGTRLSTWTPLNNRQSNLQLFEERANLVLHWFDLWTDKQRKHLLHSLLTRCTKSQLTYCGDLLTETLPVTQVDFAAVLPRFLSLYVLSFLSPRDLCSVAQVSWHWRVLAEQDCIWAGRCVRRGWFLPYTPAEKEFGAWKNHYVSCVSTLDWLTPREAAEQYGTLNRPSTGMTEEEDERRKERRIRQMIREKLQEEKSRTLSERTLLAPDLREFWKKLCGLVAPTADGGGIDIFSPLAASAPGVALIQALSALTGLEVLAPMGLVTGSFQNILSEWSDSSVRVGLSDQQPAAPALRYVCEDVLQGWCRQAKWMDEALGELRVCLGPQLQRVSLQARGRALDGVGLERCSRQRASPQRVSLSRETGFCAEESVVFDSIGKQIYLPDTCPCSVLKLYQEPLTAALNSNRAILGYADIQIILSPVTQILELNRVFLVDIQARLQQWDADQCIGDVFVKLCSSLRVYTNYLNNYTTALCTIDKVSDVGLFLFNDALVLTLRNIHHTPFTLAHRCTHTFLASVALTSLAVREITHTRYVCHAFVLEGPCRSWVCATDRECLHIEHDIDIVNSCILHVRAPQMKIM